MFNNNNNNIIIRYVYLLSQAFLPGTSLAPAVTPPLTLQASHCSTFRIMCDVPSLAVFCSESIECFPGRVSKFFFKLLVTIPVAPIITGTIVHFRFHYYYYYSSSSSSSVCSGIGISIISWEKLVGKLTGHGFDDQGSILGRCRWSFLLLAV